MSTREVSTMIKQGFISDSHLSFSPSRTLNTTFSRLYSPSSSPPPPPPPPAPPPQQHQPLSQLTDSSQPVARSNPTHSSHNPTLFEMMSQEQLLESKRPSKSQSKIVKLLSELKNPTNPNNGLGFMELGSGDVRLSVVGKDGFRVCVDVHKRVLAEKSRFFAEKLARRDKENREMMHMVEISECDDVEVYLETLILMYCEDMKKRLLGEDLDKVLALLKVHKRVCLCVYIYDAYAYIFVCVYICIYSFLSVSLVPIAITEMENCYPVFLWLQGLELTCVLGSEAEFLFILFYSNEYMLKWI